MSGRLDGKRVLLTQADTFMGPAVEELFGEEGADVMADRRDLRSQGAAARMVGEAGAVDVLIANLAATNPKTSVSETSEADWREMFETMVHPLYRLAQAVLPGMIERRRGKIIVMGSASALRGMPNWSAYSAARGAQLAFVRAVGVEVAGHNVQVNAIAQTFVENPDYFTAEYQGTEEFRRRIAQVPAGRLATAREGASLALFLASDETDFFVGQVIPFSGGWVA